VWLILPTRGNAGIRQATALRVYLEVNRAEEPNNSEPSRFETMPSQPSLQAVEARSNADLSADLALKGAFLNLEECWRSLARMHELHATIGEKKEAQFDVLSASTTLNADTRRSVI
jgi:hypothetical protein